MKNAKFQIVLKMQKIREVVTTSYIDPKGPPWSHVPFLPWGARARKNPNTQIELLIFFVKSQKHYIKKFETNGN